MNDEFTVRCPNCNGEISRCGVPNSEGIPTLDCKVCILRDEIKRLRANQEDAKSAAMDLVSTLRKERDEAREAARKLRRLGRPKSSFVDEYPWLEETPNEDD